MTGKGSLNHNSRKFHAKNTDPNRTHWNVEYCNEDIKDVYHELFDEALNVVVKHFCNTLFENSPGISSFKWCLPIIVGMRTDMIVPYVHISV